MMIVAWHEILNGKKQVVHQHVSSLKIAKKMRNEKRSQGFDAWFMEEQTYVNE